MCVCVCALQPEITKNKTTVLGFGNLPTKLAWLRFYLRGHKSSLNSSRAAPPPTRAPNRATPVWLAYRWNTAARGWANHHWSLTPATVSRGPDRPGPGLFTVGTFIIWPEKSRVGEGDMLDVPSLYKLVHTDPPGLFSVLLTLHLF